MSTPCDPVTNCAGCEKTVEVERYNRPGLPAISYRLGTHGEFFQRMLDILHADDLLRSQLTTRSVDDFGIALLDAWSTVGDVLSFYQERIANEGFLRTATERRSILEMARTIGYELNPGVAASTYLTFKVDDTDPKYAKVKVPQGTQIQNLPSQGKLPQTFETSEDFEARVEWNELKPRLSRRQTLGIRGGKLHFLSGPGEDAGDSTEKLKDFDLVNIDGSQEDNYKVIAVEVNQLYLKGTSNNLKAGDLLLFVGVNKTNKSVVTEVVTSVSVDKESNRTTVFFGGEGESLPAFKIGNSEPVATFASSLTFDAETIADQILKTDVREETLQGLISVNKWDESDLLRHIESVQSANGDFSTGQGVFVFREHVGFFGNNAPQWKSLPVSQREAEYYTKEDGTYTKLDGEPVYEESWDDGWQIWRNYPDGYYYSGIGAGADVYLERKVEDVGKDSWVIFECPSITERYEKYLIGDTADQSLTGFSLTGKAMGLKLLDIDGKDVVDAAKSGELKVRNTTAHVKSEILEPDDLSIDGVLEEEGTDSSGESAKNGVSRIMLDTLVPGMQIGQPVIVNGERVDAGGVTCHEVANIKDIIHSHGYTIIYFKEALRYRYLRDTVTINANVVEATHGETVNEVLGSGDGTKTNQCFVLKKPPMTYVSSDDPSGAESTLQVKVDGIEWEQALSLYKIGPNSPSYIVRLDNDGDVNVIFGDGKEGTRLPTGQENIKATYRSGIGADGEVIADSIKLLKTRPLGIRSATNPLPSSGSQDPETMDNARTNAPSRILTMERIVSLRDYEDFARTYSGIGKARAVILWNGKTELVHVTIADSYGNPIESSSTTYSNFLSSVEKYRDRLAIVRIDTFEKRLFQVEAKLMIDEKYTPAELLADGKSALEDAFSFTKRTFGQPVSAAEIIGVLQRVSGVIAVDLDKLYLTDPAYETDTELGPDQVEPASVLPCSNAEWPDGEDFQKAQLLLINPAGIKLEEKKS